MARSNYSAGKRAREADKARKQRDKAEKRRRRREDGPSEVPIATVEELQGAIAVVDPATLEDSENEDGENPTPRRRGMAVRLFVGGLSWHTEEDALRKAFAEHGEVLEAAVILDQEGRSRGFGFVTMGSQQAAKAAIQNMDGYELDDRFLKVSPARER